MPFAPVSPLYSLNLDAALVSSLLALHAQNPDDAKRAFRRHAVASYLYRGPEKTYQGRGEFINVTALDTCRGNGDSHRRNEKGEKKKRYVKSPATRVRARVHFQ